MAHALCIHSMHASVCSCTHAGAQLARFSPIGSPRAVPVPCTATVKTVRAGMFAAAIAARRTAVCAGPLGAVRPLERPSWLTADACVAWSGCYGIAGISNMIGQNKEDAQHLQHGNAMRAWQCAQEQHSNGLSATISVGCLVEGLAPPHG